MKLARPAAFLIALTVALTYLHRSPAADTSSVPRFAHVVDLTHTLSGDTPYIPIPGITFPFKSIPIATLPKNGVLANRWEIHEHIGTQIDAPITSSSRADRWSNCRSPASSCRSS
jgi:hypothetical protein